MSKPCECCGKRNDFFSGDEFYLDESRILCKECAAPIRDDINSLYYVKTDKEYKEIKDRILNTCSKTFNDDITNAINEVIEDIYMEDIYLKIGLDPQSEDFDINLESTPSKSITVKQNNSVNAWKMFSNIGQKIKTLAKVCTWIGIICSILCGLVVIFEGGDIESILIGFLIGIAGSLFSWIGSFLLYGFGQLVENSDKIVKSLETKEQS